MRQRVLAVIEGRQPDRLPFVERLVIWWRSHRHNDTLPEEFEGLTISEAHSRLGMGEEVFAFPWSVRLRGVEVVSRFEGEVAWQEVDPVVNHFPDIYDSLPAGRVGVTETEFITPVGTLRVTHEVHDFMLRSGIARPYLRRHPVQEETDYDIAAYILERAEPVLQSERVKQEEARVGEGGFVVPLLRRVPFQQLLLEYIGEESLFYALHDDPARVERLLAVLDAHYSELVDTLEGLDVPYVEFCDNIEGTMTTPRLYARYVLPAHRRYTERLHAQGKKVGSHADGNLEPLLALLTESGLDVCESFTPTPVTNCPFEAAWEAWLEDGPAIWGGIPSVLLEKQTPEDDFRASIKRLCEFASARPMILGIGDMVMPEAILGRIRYIAERAGAVKFDGAP
jgi:hypothetical protein